MARIPFLSLGRPKLIYPEFWRDISEVRDPGLPDRVRLIVRGRAAGDIELREGLLVRTGEKLQLTEAPEDYVISTLTGRVSGISEHRGYLNEPYLTVDIWAYGEERLDDSVSGLLSESAPGVARSYLRSLPGAPDFSSLLNLRPPVNTVVINGLDQDVGVLTNQHVVCTDVRGIIEGIDYLRKAARIGRVVLVVREGVDSGLRQAGCELMEVRPEYPNGVYGRIAQEVLGSDFVPGRRFDEMGLGFITAEAVCALAGVFGAGRLPVDKLVTVVGPSGDPRLVKVRLGTPVGWILKRMGLEPSYGDRVILGGPMRGRAVWSEDTPIDSATDGIMVQSSDQVVLSTDSQCVNCGQCVRACPSRIPVNMLVRVLSGGMYGEEAESYDLHSCIECGLCSYVCVARIPVFHYIMLGKYENARLREAEGSNA